MTKLLNNRTSKSVLYMIVALLCSFYFIACQTNENANSYFSKTSQDSLLANIITYTSEYARGANNLTRFEPQFRAEYVSRLPNYKLIKYNITPDSVHYFFISRPAGTIFRRGVGGKFRLKKGSLVLTDYEELWCTPHFKSDTLVVERGSYLFGEMVKKGNINHLLAMKHYIEWPDSTLVYDTQKHEWVSTRKAPF
jgi:hypothetical protein